MVALGWGGPPTDAARDLPPALSALFDLPGARYLLVVEEAGDGDRVRGELGGAPEADLAVLAWARRLAGVAHERGRVFSDVVLTTATAVHLARPLPANRWVVLRLDREEGNLALARRALAGAAAPALDRPPHRPRLLSALPDDAPASPAAPCSRTGAADPAAVPGVTPAAVPGVTPAAMPGVMPPAAPLPRRSGEELSSGAALLPRRSGEAPSSGATPLPRQSGTATGPHTPGATPVPELPGPPQAGPGVPALAFLPPTATPTPTRVVRGTGDARADTAAEPGPDAPVRARTAGRPVPRDATTGGPARTDAADTDADATAIATAIADATATDTATDTATPTDTAERDTPGATADVTDDADATSPAEADDLVVGTSRRPLTVRQARAWRTPDPEVPAARESAERSRPAPEVPAPRTGSLFAPVVVVPPPPSPVDDDTTEVPAPVPYPIITAPPLEAPEAAVPEPEATPAGLPRRVPGAHLAASLPAPAPPPAPTPAGIPGWNTEVSVLRRLLSGLRRLS